MPVLVPPAVYLSLLVFLDDIRIRLVGLFQVSILQRTNYEPLDLGRKCFLRSKNSSKKSSQTDDTQEVSDIYNFDTVGRCWNFHVWPKDGGCGNDGWHCRGAQLRTDKSSVNMVCRPAAKMLERLATLDISISRI